MILYTLSLMTTLTRLMEEVWSKSPPKAISPRGMVSTIRRVGKQFRTFQQVILELFSYFCSSLVQEDAHEYLRQLLSFMHEEILKVNRVKLADAAVAETSLISRVFGGELCNTLSCDKCKHISRTINHFQDLSLDITSGIDSIDAAIAAFTRPERLASGNEWLCDSCKKRVQVPPLFILYVSSSVSQIPPPLLPPPF